MERTCCVQNVLNVGNNFCTQHVLLKFELGIFMYWTCNAMNNLSSYCGLVDAKKRSFWQRFTCKTVRFILSYNKNNAQFFNFVSYLNFLSWKICVVFSRPQFLCWRPLWPRTSAFGSLYPMKNMTSFLWVCAKSLLLSFARQTTLYSMAIRVVEFLSGVYKIGKIFA